MDNGCVAILDVRSGRALDQKELPQTMHFLYEARFFEGVLQLSLGGGGVKRNFLFTITVSPDGKIMDLSSSEALVCGLPEDRSRLGVVENYKDPSCSVVVLDKMR
jgi:hypothetical protein